MKSSASIMAIIHELNESNGSNYKMDVLRKYADNELLQRVLKMTYDRATFTYGITQNTVPIDDIMIGGETSGMGSFDPMYMDLAFALDILVEYFAKKKFTGHDARDAYRDLLYACDAETAWIVMAVINRDLRINMGRSNINKVFKGLIVKPSYMRCATYSKKTAGKINPIGSFIQVKADGTYREFTLESGKVSCISRSGEEYDYPDINSVLIEEGRDGVYHGELTVYDLDGNLLDRATGNGIINSNDFTGYFLKLDVWDYIHLSEYSDASNKIKCTTAYDIRFRTVEKLFPRREGRYRISAIESYRVDTVQMALKYVSGWMNEGKEGGIWKDKDSVFRDGTNPQQQKLKLEIDAEVRITGFTAGTVGTKNEHLFGAMTFTTDDGKVVGRVGVSSMKDAQVKDFNSRRDELIGTIMTVQFNDITKGRNNDHYALSHPRFIELRADRDDTDTLERIEESKRMAMELKYD